MKVCKDAKMSIHLSAEISAVRVGATASDGCEPDSGAICRYTAPALAGKSSVLRPFFKQEFNDLNASTLRVIAAICRDLELK